jgi:N-hydroxyarylamine O-acetyltransferase
MIDLDAYFARIGVCGPLPSTRTTLDRLTCAHACAIPFENLDVLLGRPIDLAPEAIFDKLVTRRRGGYCFEQNALFLEVLEALGFEARPLAARVRLDRPRGIIPPRTHVFLRVEVEGHTLLTDVGVGALSLTAPLQLDTEEAQSTPHDRRRIVREGGPYVHQAEVGGEWTDVCEFGLDEMPYIDRVIANWYTSTHPESLFLNRLMVARATADGGRITLQNGEIKRRGRDGRAEARALATADELLAVLAAEFDLRFPPGTRFGAPGAPWPTR